MTEAPTNQLALLSSTALVPGWKWRSRDGQHTAPAAMETRHLFHTLRMIWNNWAPPAARVGHVILYHFDRRNYPPIYMAEAIVHCWNELQSRDDIMPEWQRQLDQMRAWFTTKIPEGAAAALEHQGSPTK